MHNPLRVRFLQPRTNLQRQIRSFALRQPPKTIQHRTQALAFHKFHRGVGDSGHAIEFIHAANIFVRYFSRKEQFVLETVHHGLIRSNLRLQKFQRHGFARLAIARFVDVPHASMPSLGQNFVTHTQRSKRRRA